MNFLKKICFVLLFSITSQAFAIFPLFDSSKWFNFLMPKNNGLFVGKKAGVKVGKAFGNTAANYLKNGILSKIFQRKTESKKSEAKRS